MTSPFLDLPRFSLAATLKVGVKALYASYPRAMPDHPDYPPPLEDYRRDPPTNPRPCRWGDRIVQRAAASLSAIRVGAVDQEPNALPRETPRRPT